MRRALSAMIAGIPPVGGEGRLGCTGLVGHSGDGFADVVGDLGLGGEGLAVVVDGDLA